MQYIHETTSVTIIVFPHPIYCLEIRLLSQTTVATSNSHRITPEMMLQVAAVSSSMPRKLLKEEAFPVKLYKLLEEVERAGEEYVIGWSSDGLKFTVYQPKIFAQTWMKRYFNQSKYKSFQRQLNLYNFYRESKGTIKGICKYSCRLFTFIELRFGRVPLSIVEE
jgi:hypothetical protein